ncbi:hypothetical protein BCON_0014g00370 [Botryotinia convoluta]|uniref:Uncharacterized protein n=1 Tax=Botryotinia convoluta TaxID=54673 RepID=A0A4Z1IP73_9HELO|nr:hypothetical protein BCON_0014g00370 [Botryotinia convoluta]
MTDIDSTTYCLAANMYELLIEGTANHGYTSDCEFMEPTRHAARDITKIISMRKEGFAHHQARSSRSIIQSCTHTHTMTIYELLEDEGIDASIQC